MTGNTCAEDMLIAVLEYIKLENIEDTRRREEAEEAADAMFWPAFYEFVRNTLAGKIMLPDGTHVKVDY